MNGGRDKGSCMYTKEQDIGWRGHNNLGHRRHSQSQEIHGRFKEFKVHQNLEPRKSKESESKLFSCISGGSASRATARPQQRLWVWTPVLTLLQKLDFICAMILVTDYAITWFVCWTMNDIHSWFNLFWGYDAQAREYTTKIWFVCLRRLFCIALVKEGIHNIQREPERSTWMEGLHD